MASANEAGQGRRRTRLAVEVAIAILFVAVISFGVTRGFVTTTEEATRHYALAVTLDLRAPGTVEIIATGDDAISVEKRVRDLWGMVTTSEQVQDRTLDIRSRYANRWIVSLGDCRVDYSSELPPPPRCPAPPPTARWTSRA